VTPPPAAQVVLALEHIHAVDILYRDLLARSLMVIRFRARNDRAAREARAMAK
jgi:hypothetical protein